MKRAIARSLTIWSQTVDSAAEFCRALDLLQQTGARSPVAISSISAAAEAMQEIAKCVQSWHLVPIVRDGKQDGFLREFGAPMFDYIRANPHYSAVFNRAMTSYSVVETQWALAALVSEDFSQIRTLCDVGGGHGHLACGLLSAYPQLRATVLDLPDVVGETDRLWAPKLGLSQRCRYLGGDMFHEVPLADAYILKSVLHNWNDDECVRLLVNLRRAVVGAGRVFVVDFFVPGPEEPHFSKLFDIHMMLMVTGRERTAAELAELLAAAGWRYDAWHRVPNAFHSVIAATAA